MKEMDERPLLTPREREVMAFIRDFFQKNRRPTTYWAIAKAIGWKSKRSAVIVCERLKAKGYLKKGIRFLEPWDGYGVGIEVPILLRLVAGLPLLHPKNYRKD